VIRIEALDKSFGAPALRRVTLTVPRGCLYGLVGPGASGKSLLLRMVAGLTRPDAGRIVVDGRDVRAMDPLTLAGYRLTIGMLFQNNALFDAMTVAENVAFPLTRVGGLSPEAIRDRVAERLAAVSLAEFAQRLPGGLSGGQKKRVGVARATVTRAPILLYDEPAAGLDPVTSQRIFDLLRAEQARSAATVLMVSSDIERLLAVSDRVGMMYRGELIFDGTTKEAVESAEPRVKQFVHGLTEGPL